MHKRAQIQSSPSHLDMSKLTQPLYDAHMPQHSSNVGGYSEAMAVKSAIDIPGEGMGGGGDGTRGKVHVQGAIGRG